MLKRAFDLGFSVGALLLLFPVFLVSAVWIRRDSPGPVFYRGIRVGRWGRTFRIYKFRTMVADAEQRGGPSSSEDDPRITRAGRFLRKYKLDELPQLINVVLGDMSLVGPRPEVPHYVDLYTEEEKSILSVRPGISDWASIWNSDEGAFLAGSPNAEKTYQEEIRPEKIRLQLKYVREQSFRVDLKILAETAKLVGARLLGQGK